MRIWEGMTMLRTMTMICGLSLAATLMPLTDVLATGMQTGRHSARPSPDRVGKQTEFHGRVLHARQAFHARHGGGERRFADGGRVWRGQSRTPFGASAYLGPGFYPFNVDVPMGSVREPSKPFDLNSFENMPARMGIARAPTPQPTLYRIEGRSDHPVTRVIRIGEPEPRNAKRSRYAHAETGALLLTVPGR